MTPVQELQKKVIEEVGFSLAPATKLSFGAHVPTGVIHVLDRDGNVLREASPEDIQKWKTAWDRIAGEATRQMK